MPSYSAGLLDTYILVNVNGAPNKFIYFERRTIIMKEQKQI